MSTKSIDHERICPMCQQCFDIKEGRRRYCSKTCASEANRRRALARYYQAISLPELDALAASMRGELHRSEGGQNDN